MNDVSFLEYIDSNSLRINNFKAVKSYLVSGTIHADCYYVGFQFVTQVYCICDFH